jgi:Ca-activated chloride channel homolog
MEWEAPQFLYLILPLCCGWFLLALYSERRRQRAREAFVAKPMWSRVLPRTSRSRFWIKLVLREIALAAGLMAIAGPKFGTVLEQVVPRGSDLYVLIDVSRSMLADDVPPSRLDRAKSDVSALVNRLDGERVGLIAFAGQAVVKCPLTVDYDSFRRALNELDPTSAPRGGTAIGDAIRKALEVFDGESRRDQAVLLITDGDDQESYPLEAATVAAEKNITVFTVGLGDAETGSRVPIKGTASFAEHEGQQVWSKLNGALLQEIALKTSGVYVPAGTRAYDLGELYTSHLQGRHGDESESHQRIRKSERFQIFLAITLLALLIDLSVSPYPVKSIAKSKSFSKLDQKGKSSRNGNMAATTLSILLFMVAFSSDVLADEEDKRLRSGIKFYDQDKFEEASKEFAAVSESLEKQKSEKAAIAAFDEACAYHRQGEHQKARDRYLKAGLSRNRSIAMASHFNLGTMSAEKGRELAGKQPEEVPPKEREAILNELKQAIGSYRHCLELDPDHPPSRRNLELLRNWIKYYSDRWRERDRQKLRDESNLIEFLEFVMKSQSSLQATVKQLPEIVAGNTFAELKRMQTELREEMPTLREKIAKELAPEESQAGGAPQALPQEVQEGIKLLQSWADEADKRMASASQQLGKLDAKATLEEQQAAIDEVDKIWDAVIPFRPLLTREFSDQTAIAKTLVPDSSSASEEIANDNVDGTKNSRNDDESQEAKRNGSKDGIEKESESANDRSDADSKSTAKPRVVTDEEMKQLTEQQDKALRKAKLLAPKAQAELQREENRPEPSTTDSPPKGSRVPAPADANTDPNGALDSPSQSSDDAEQLKAGLKKAIELAPKAVDAMEAALRSLRKRDNAAAGPHAEKARRILEEILESQPKQKQENKDQQDQEKKEQDEKQDKSQDKGQDEQKQDQQSQEEKKPQDNQEKKPEEKSNESKQPEPQQIAKDRIEEALRKVRERQEEKRDRDREMRMRIMVPGKVDKDW